MRQKTDVDRLIEACPSITWQMGRGRTIHGSSAELGIEGYSRLTIRVTKTREGYYCGIYVRIFLQEVCLGIAERKGLEDCLAAAIGNVLGFTGALKSILAGATQGEREAC